MHVRESHVASAEAVGESCVIDAEQVQHGGMKIVDFGFVGDGLVAEIVCGAVDGTTFDTATGHPHGEAEGVMIATI